MFLDYIKLKDYRQYKDVMIDFADPTKGKHIVVIEGANGSGKTNLMNAITWCLFEEEKHLKKGKEGLPRINLGTLRAAKPGEIIEVSVELCFRDVNGKPTYVKRSEQYKKVKGKKPRTLPYIFDGKETDSRLMVQYQEERDIVTDINPTRYVNQMIPKRLSDYFFFDGEKLQDYFETESTDQIKEAVFRLSQCELLRETIEHLKSLKKRMRRKTKSYSDEEENLKKQVEAKEKQIDQVKKELEGLIEKKKAADREFDDVNAKIALTNVESIKRLHGERQTVESFIEKLGEDLEGYEQDITELVMEWSPVAMLMESIETTRKLVAEAEESGELPPPYKKNFLESLLEKEMCICDTVLHPGSPPYESVLQKKDTCDAMTDDSEEISRLDAELRGIWDGFPKQYERLVRLNSDLKADDATRKKKLEELENLSDLIGDVDVENIKKLEEERTEAKKLVDNLGERIGITRSRLDRFAYDLRELEKEHRRVLRSDEKSRLLADRLELIDRAEETAERILEEILEEMREEVRTETGSHFMNLIWKESTFKDVSLSDDYEVSVSMGSDVYSNVVSSLSAGETQVLALSFMAALNTVARAGVPIVIDTPLSRISSQPRALIADKLPKYLESSQLILMMTDTEYTNDVRDRLKGAVGTELRIEYKEASEYEIDSWVVDYV